MIDFIPFSQSVNLNVTPETCKGLIFRGVTNEYINSRNEYVETKRFRPLKRKSCSGCSTCGWLMEDLQESISCNSNPIFNECNNGELYKLTVTNQSRDPETGVIDDYDLEFVKHTTEITEGNTRGGTGAVKPHDNNTHQITPPPPPIPNKKILKF